MKGERGERWGDEKTGKGRARCMGMGGEIMRWGGGRQGVSK